MNEDNGYNSGNVTPYRATGNLNTAIGNPSVNINDTMNVNIQSMATNQMPVTNNQNYNSQIPTGVEQVPTNVNNNINNINVNSNVVNNQVNNSVDMQNSQDNSFVKRTYVTTDNRPKKKNIPLSLGSEFKIALLIIVILLVFIFLLPVISDYFRGY